MNKKLLLLLFVASSVFSARAQVEDISVIITPTVGYSWFDKKSTVEEGPMYGIQAGFGFGKFIELRGIYERSIGLKQQFGYYQNDIQQVFPNFQFKDRDIKVNRIGGEFKANIHAGDFSPYILLGTGVQTFEWNLAGSDALKNQNIYGSAGLGFKINLSDRVTLNLEGRGLVYNMNPGSMLFDPSYVENPDNPSFGSWIGDKSSNRMYNWSATAGLQFYLGGRNESRLSALDKAYLRRFSGDMSGLKLTLSPIVAYVEFNDETNFRNTYFAGAQLGFDMSEYIGLRGYFLQAKEDDEIDLKFDKLSMYGIDFVGKLNVPRGIVPYVTIGGGYLDVNEEYEGRTKRNQPSSQYFAKGGLGLDVPLGKHIDIFGAANLLFTVDNENRDFTEIIQPNQLKRHTMYHAGLRLKIGASSRTDHLLEESYQSRFNNERNAYDHRIMQLEMELKEAYDTNDVEKATKVIEEKKRMEVRQRGGMHLNEDSVVILTPKELERIIDKAVKSADENDSENIEGRLNSLEQLLVDLNRKYEIANNNQESPAPLVIKETEPATRTIDTNNRDKEAQAAQQEANETLLKEIKKLNDQIENQKNDLGALKLQQDNTKSTAVEIEKRSKPGKSFHIDYGFLGGVNFGQASTFNLGVRRYVSYSNTSLIFMPEIYFALGDKKGFGISANGIIPFKTGNESSFKPYAGIGLGLNLLNKKWSLNPNFIAGISYQTIIGGFFADYTVRGAFKNNQIAAGYRFKF